MNSAAHLPSHAINGDCSGIPTLNLCSTRCFSVLIRSYTRRIKLSARPLLSDSPTRLLTGTIRLGFYPCSALCPPTMAASRSDFTMTLTSCNPMLSKSWISRHGSQLAALGMSLLGTRCAHAPPNLCSTITRRGRFHFPSLKRPYPA